MYQAPEVEHLQRAVDAVKRGLVPQIEHAPEPEPDTLIDTGEYREDEPER